MSLRRAPQQVCNLPQRRRRPAVNTPSPAAIEPAAASLRLRALVHRLDGLAWLPALFARVAIGVVFVQSGLGKLQNLDNVTQFFTQLGIPLASVQAPVIAGLELVGGALIVLGLGTRLAAALLACVMLVATATAVWPQLESWRGVLGTIETAYFSIFVYLVVHGAGALSVDTLVARRLRLAATK